MRLRLCRLRMRLCGRWKMRFGLEKLFGPPAPLAKPGLYHFRPGGDFQGKRVHLRVESDGSGLLLIDASKVLHLNPTACDFAWLRLSGVPQQEAVKSIRRRYRIGRAAADSDWAEFHRTVDCLLADEPVCPVTFLGLDRIEPFTTPVTAPYRADLALTYRCNISCSHCYNETREKAELDTASWKKAINRLWDVGIPHVCFTGGEATLRPDLADLVAHAESAGMVSGLLTNGVKLADRPYLESLAGAGLDYVQITLESYLEEIHNRMVGAESYGDTIKGILNCVELPIYTITNTTITKANASSIPDTVDFLARMGLKAFAVNSVISSGKAVGGDFALTPDQLAPVLEEVRRRADKAGLRMIWYSPTRYCELDPLSLELGPKRCTAAQYNICIEPDGSVLPCQSYYESAGNILRDSWESIYGSRLFAGLRNRDWIGESCIGCESLPLCGGGCPLEAGGKAAACQDILSNP
jgi:radical SAM protein with 4Fe4S-binding SPASM domain